MKKSNNKKPALRITDKERLNWLERQVVEVRRPVVYGSFHTFLAAPADEDGEVADYYPSDIRDKIDKEIKKSQK